MGWRGGVKQSGLLCAEIGSRPSGGGREQVTDGLPLPPNELHGKGDVGEDEVERRLQVLAV